MNRIIVIGRNDELPQLSRYVLCPECGGSGNDYNHYICPLAKVWKKERIPCPVCNGDCVVERKA